MKHLLWPLFSACALVLSSTTADGAAIPLTEARIERIVNEVQVIQPSKVPRPARISQVIKDDLGVRTGQKSRCELRFQDETLTRLGAETIFSFKEGTREMTLDDGTMLLQVPKDHGGATIRTGAVSASVTGTTLMVEHLPKQSVKILVLEGSVRVSMNGRPAEKASITAGRMIVIQPQDKKIGKPVNVDLQKIIKTSVLIDPAKFSGNSKMQAAALPSMPLIAKASEAQAKLIKDGTLVPTNLTIAGRGTAVSGTAEKPGTRMSPDGVASKAAEMERPNSQRLSGDRSLASSQATTALVSAKVASAVEQGTFQERLVKAVAESGSSRGEGGGTSKGSTGTGSGRDDSGTGSSSGGSVSAGSGGGSSGSGSGGSGSGSGSGGSGSGSGSSGSGSGGSGNSGSGSSGSGSSGSGSSGSGSSGSGSSGSGSSGSGSGSSGSGSSGSGSSGSGNSGSGSSGSGSSGSNSGSGSGAVREVLKEVKKELKAVSGKGNSGSGSSGSSGKGKG